MEPFEGKRIVLWVTPQAVEADGARELYAVSEELGRLGCRVETLVSDQAAAAGERLRIRPPDLILAHVCNQCREPLELLAPFEERIRPVVGATSGKPLPPVVLLATAHDMPVYLEGMRRGAFDCVGLPLQEKEFIRILSRALQEPALGRTP